VLAEIRRLVLTDGDRESELGLHAHSGGLEKRWSSRGAINDCEHPQSGWHSTQSWAADDLAHVSPRALARSRGGGLFHNGGFEPSPIGDVLHAVCARVAVAACSCNHPHPDEAFVVQAMRDRTNVIDGVLPDLRILICDRDRKWSRGVLAFLEDEGVRSIQTPFRAPNCNAYAERFVRSIKEECASSA
jgi:hypothetical protein